MSDHTPETGAGAGFFELCRTRGADLSTARFRGGLGGRTVSADLEFSDGAGAPVTVR